jgi:hypothetical protein
MRSKYIGIKYLALLALQIDQDMVGSSPLVVDYIFPTTNKFRYHNLSLFGGERTVTESIGLIIERRVI